MNIEKNQIDALDLQVTIQVAADDYAPAYKKKLNERKRNADFKGFRKGMAPMSLIQRVYGEQALYESVNDVLSSSLSGFIQENKLRVVGEPLPSEDQPEVEWKAGNDLTFKFDIATLPELSLEISKEDKVPYYNINVTEQAKKEMKGNMLRQVGSLEDADAAGEEDFVIADLDQEGKSVEGAYISVRNVAGDAHARFVGAKVGDSFSVNVNEAFTDETDRASMLKVSKDELAALNPEFNVTITSVRTFVAAKENQDTYDKLFGEDKVHSAEEFDAAVAERLASNYKQEADYRLSKDIRNHFVEKAGIELPEAFLKRWLLHINEGKFSAEDIDRDFDAFAADYRWQLVRDFVMGKYDLKIEDADMQEAAEAYAAYQYAMYGMGNVPQDMIRDYARRLMEDERQVRQIAEQVEDQKVIAALKENITLQSKKISVDKFRELK